MKTIRTRNSQWAREILSNWAQKCRARDFAIDLDFEYAMDVLQRVLDTKGELILAVDDNGVQGLFAIQAMPSYLGDQKFAIERFWYAEPGSLRAGPALYKEALKWSQEHGCSHLIIAASNLASGMHDRVCSFLEKMGMERFETSFIKEIK